MFLNQPPQTRKIQNKTGGASIYQKGLNIS
jgi:hypothetical protein